MVKQLTRFIWVVILFWAILALQSMALTDYHDVLALQNLYRSLNSPPQLKEWKPEGGDPCKESWTGIYCAGSSVIHVMLQGLNLSGNLGFELANLQSLKQLDLSSNKIYGPIPYSLPLNLTHLNLAENNLNENIPYSLTLMKHLRHLNLSHNVLSGPLGDVFNGLENLREMDLSYNNLTGDLPSSFGLLTNLTKLFLERNGFTGSVIYLSKPPLSDLNIADNHFSGVIPDNFRNITNLWIGGNKFDLPPWSFQIMAVNSRSHEYQHENYKKKKRIILNIIFWVCGIMIVTSVVVMSAGKLKRSRAKGLTTTTVQRDDKELLVYKCEHCISTKDTPKGLIHHMNKNHRNMKFKCPDQTCPLSFSTKSDLRSHCEVKHGKSVASKV